MALFNAKSVGDEKVRGMEKRVEITEFITDNNLDLLFITETWLNLAGRRRKDS